MSASVFCGVSVDGFIARPNGALDWLPAEPEEHGFTEFLASVDAIVMGRNTFDVLMGFDLDEWPYGDKRIVVLTRRALEISKAKALGGVVDAMNGTPAEIVSRLAAEGARHLYVDGGITVQEFLRAGLVDRLVITRVPVLIGQGIPLFGSLPADVTLRHVATRSFPSGLVQSEYRIGG